MTIESKALDLLSTYDGKNNYILKLKYQSEQNNKFYPTRSQADYILSYFESVPKVANKWVELDPYFAKKISDDFALTTVINKMWIDKLLVEKDKSYHIWGKFNESDKSKDYWIPKAAIIKAPKINVVNVDYEKYSHRPPMNHQKEAIEKLLTYNKFILADDMGVGKFIVNNTPIYTPTGYIKIGDLKVGDRVIGSDGNPYNVTGVFPQGEKELYKITFNDNYTILAGDEHLWSVSSPNYGKNRNNERLKKSLILSTKQMYEGEIITINGNGHNSKKSYEINTYYKSSNGNNKWQIPIVKPIQFESNTILPIDPYLLGLGLGDGYFYQKTIRFSVHKDDFDELFNNFLIKENKPFLNKRNGYVIVGNSLYDLNIERTRSNTKFIPDIYKYTSIDNRLALLQGLMDTDGYCIEKGRDIFGGTEYTTISEKLCDDVAEIVHSLGGICRKHSKIGSYKKDGVKIECNRAYRLNIKLPNGMNPFRLKRKAQKYNEPKKYPVGRYISKIEKCGFGECTCISVDSPDKLYVAEHAIVTHNTTSTTIAALETGIKRVLIICPATLKINWKRELQNYTDRSIFIAESKNFSDDADFVIVNYDILKNFHDLDDLDNSKIKDKFDLIVLDEAHYVSNPQAQRTKIINSIAKTAKYIWLLTGTPLTSKPINYYNLLYLIDSPVAQNWMAYVIRYCNGFQFKAGKRKVWNTKGATNLDELRERTSKQILRRLKTDVLDLPDKIITPVYLNLKSKEYEKLMGDYYEWFKNKKSESTSLTVQFSKIMAVRQVIANEKLSSTIEIAENILEQGKKVIIFSNFTEPLKKIYEHFGKKAVYLDGSVKEKDRQMAVDLFQTDDNIQVFCGNLLAAGVGLTLTAAEACIMNDLSFVPAHHSQAEDRAFRYGQKNNVSIYYPIFENTIEGVIYDILSNKKDIIDTVMGDNLNKADVAEQIMNLINNI
jgi:hypothetical protein